MLSLFFCSAPPNATVHVCQSQSETGIVMQISKSPIGALQGDFLSRCLFTLVLAGAFNKLRWTIALDLNRPIPPISIAGLKLDSE